MRNTQANLLAMTKPNEFMPEQPMSIWDGEQLAGLTRKQAQIELKGGISSTELAWNAELEKHAEAFRKKLLKHFGNQISKKPEAFAMAIASINDDLPKRLMDTDAWKSSLEQAMEDAEYDEEEAAEIENALEGEDF
jgi:hypothetical protein